MEVRKGARASIFLHNILFTSIMSQAGEELAEAEQNMCDAAAGYHKRHSRHYQHQPNALAQREPFAKHRYAYYNGSDRLQCPEYGRWR